MEGLVTLIIGGGLLAYVFVWYEGYAKQRDQDQRDREQANRDALHASERLGASHERARAALEIHLSDARRVAGREEQEHAAWITVQTAEVERSTDEAWQESAVLAPLHRHWWRLADAASLYMAKEVSDGDDRPAAQPNLDKLARELIADGEWDELDEEDRDELDEEIRDELVAELLSEFMDDDDRWTVHPSTEYLHEALNAAISALAQHRPNDALLIERALAGQADIPEFFCGAEHLATILDTIGNIWPDRNPTFARDPFQDLR